MHLRYKHGTNVIHLRYNPIENYLYKIDRHRETSRDKEKETYRRTRHMGIEPYPR